MGSHFFVYTWVFCLVWAGHAFGQSSPLVTAAGKGDVAALNSLLAGGAGPNEVDNSVVKGWTPLMAAAKAGSAEVVEALLKAHANVNATNEYGATALDIAVANHGDSSTVAAMIRAAGGAGRGQGRTVEPITAKVNPAEAAAAVGNSAPPKSDRRSQTAKASEGTVRNPDKAAGGPGKGKRYHVAKIVPHYSVSNARNAQGAPATPDQIRAAQDKVNRITGAMLLTDEGESFSGLLAVNSRGSVLAATSMNFGAPGAVILVSAADDNGWWRPPDIDNVVVLIEMLKTDEDSNWRATAAEALSSVRTPPATEALAAAAKNDPDYTVRHVAKSAIEH
jgi:hypothetical protein